MQDQVTSAIDVIDRVLMANFTNPRSCKHLLPAVFNELVNTFELDADVATKAATQYFGVTVQ